MYSTRRYKNAWTTLQMSLQENKKSNCRSRQTQIIQPERPFPNRRRWHPFSSFQRFSLLFCESVKPLRSPHLYASFPGLVLLPQCLLLHPCPQLNFLGWRGAQRNRHPHRSIGLGLHHCWHLPAQYQAAFRIFWKGVLIHSGCRYLPVVRRSIAIEQSRWALPHR